MPNARTLQLEFYRDSNRKSDIKDVVASTDLKKFYDKCGDYEKLPFDDLLKSDTIKPIKKYKGYYEVRYLFSKPPYRVIAFVYGKLLVLLLAFKGSGSNGEVEKHMEKAKNRKEDWLSRNS